MNFLRNIKSMIRRTELPDSEATVAESTSQFTAVAASGLVVDGADCTTLKSLIYQFQLSGAGAVGAAATDAGMGKSPSEDAVVIVPEADFAAVIDGVGGYWGGNQAARFFGDGFCQHPTNFDHAIRYAQSQLKAMKFEDSLKLYGSSACFISARVIKRDTRRFVEVGQTGDCRLVIYRANGDLVESEDESYVNDLVAKELISPDHATYHEMRNRITNSLRLAFKNQVTENPSFMLNGKRRQIEAPIEIFPGDRMCLMSDGVSDNLTVEEIGQLIRGKTPDEAIVAVSDVTDQRMNQGTRIIEGLVREYLRIHEGIEDSGLLDRAMIKIRDQSSQFHWLFNAVFRRARHRAGRFPDGYVSKPSQDNRALVVIDFFD